LNASVHVIRRQRLELTLAEQTEASALQQRVAQLFNEEVVPAMDAVMSALLGPHEQLHIDSLEIDLGFINLAELDEQFSQRVTLELSHALTLQRQEAVAADSTASEQAAFDEQALPAAIKATSSSLVAALVYFLRNGQLPWWQGQQAAFDPDETIQAVLKDAPLIFISALRDVPAERLARRLVKQFLRPSLDKLLMTLLGGESAELSEALEQVLQIVDELSESSSQLVFRERLIVALLQVTPATTAEVAEVIAQLITQFISGQGRGDSSLISAQFLQAIEKTFSASAPLRRRMIEIGVLPTEDLINTELRQSFAHPSDKQTPSTSGIKKPDSRALKSAAIAPTHTPVSQFGNTNNEGNHKGGVDIVGSSSGEATVLTSEQNRSIGEQEDTLAEAGEGLYLENAGLVLLWPYLPRLFGQLGLANDQGFFSPSMQERGVLILEHMVSGEFEFPENRLVLNKILCGWPLGDHVARQLGLSQSELMELNDLLLSLIEHWQALKNTSPAGLREGFLQRSGRLTKDDMGWRLIVNRAGHDILLDSLPWGIGLISLPWMEQPLRVEW